MRCDLNNTFASVKDFSASTLALITLFHSTKECSFWAKLIMCMPSWSGLDSVPLCSVPPTTLLLNYPVVTINPLAIGAHCDHSFTAPMYRKHPVNIHSTSGKGQASCDVVKLVDCSQVGRSKPHLGPMTSYMPGTELVPTLMVYTHVPIVTLRIYYTMG